MGAVVLESNRLDSEKTIPKLKFVKKHATAMPIYEYECTSCHKVTETQQKFSDPPLATCPTCGGQVQKLISRTSFQLKGSGWYATDYKKSPASPASTTSSTESKPEVPKVEPKPSGSGDGAGQS